MELLKTLLDVKEKSSEETNEKNIQKICGKNKTKLYALTGFLGAGKTTILTRILHQLTSKGKRTGVIQNEFGKLGIDGEVLKNEDIQMIEINRGSVFCSCLRLTFVKALIDMADKNLDYLFIESSGLGDPSNIEEILEAAAVAGGDIYDFQGVICLVDAVNFFDQLNDLETVYRQLKHCHYAVITKTDLIDEKKMAELKDKIREINPVCEIGMSSDKETDLSFLEENLLQYKWAESEETTNTVETKPKTLFMDFSGEISLIFPEKFLQKNP